MSRPDPRPCPNCSHTTFSERRRTAVYGRVYPFSQSDDELVFESNGETVTMENSRVVTCGNCLSDFVLEDDTLVPLADSDHPDPDRVTTRHAGEFTSLSIEGVTADSVTVDFKTDPPRLLVHTDHSDEPTHKIPLPEPETNA